MFKAFDDTTIQIIKVDESVSRMVIDQACPRGGRCASNITFSSDKLRAELILGELRKPHDRVRGFKVGKES